jgi:hypothetical protein
MPGPVLLAGEAGREDHLQLGDLLAVRLQLLRRRIVGGRRLEAPLDRVGERLAADGLHDRVGDPGVERSLTRSPQPP